MATTSSKSQNNTVKNKGNGNMLKKINPAASRKTKEKGNNCELPEGKLTRRRSLDIQSSQQDSPRKSSLDSIEPKSILKNKRRSSVALGDLPRSSEFEQIMASLWASKLSPKSSTESLHSSSGKQKGCDDVIEDESFSDSGSDRDFVKSGCYRVDNDREGYNNITKKIRIMERSSEKTKFEGLNGLKMPPLERPKNYHRLSRKRPADLYEENTLNCTVHMLPDHVFSDHVTDHQNNTSSSPLVLQIYNHKKARDLVAKRIQTQKERVKKKRLLFKKSLFFNSDRSSGKETSLNSIQTELGKSNTNSNSKSQPRHDHTKNPQPLNRSKTHHGVENHKTDSVETFREKLYDLQGKKQQQKQHQQPIQQQKKELHQPQKYNSIGVGLGQNDENTRSYGSMSITSVTSNYHNYANNSQRYINPKPWNSPDKRGYSIQYESYNGYVHKNKKILLTKKYVPSSHYNGSLYNPRAIKDEVDSHYHWDEMDPGTLLDKQISLLSISGNAN